MSVFQVTFLKVRLKLPVKYEERRFLLNKEQFSFGQRFEKVILQNKGPWSLSSKLESKIIREQSNSAVVLQTSDHLENQSEFSISIWTSSP